MLGEIEELQQEKPIGLVSNKSVGGWKGDVNLTSYKFTASTVTKNG